MPHARPGPRQNHIVHVFAIEFDAPRFVLSSQLKLKTELVNSARSRLVPPDPGSTCLQQVDGRFASRISSKLIFSPAPENGWAH